MTIPCGGGLASVPLLGTLECSYEHRRSSTELGVISSFLSIGGGRGEGGGGGGKGKFLMGCLSWGLLFFLR